MCIVRELRWSAEAMVLDAIPPDREEAAAEMCPRFGRGRDRWRAICESREIIPLTVCFFSLEDGGKITNQTTWTRIVDKTSQRNRNN